MKLTMKNIGVIRDAEIELDGITVLAGLNGTGKSTVSKALYSAIAPYVNLSNEIADERLNSVYNIITFSLMAPFSHLYGDRAKLDTPRIRKLSADLASRRCPVPERYEDWGTLFPELLQNRDSALERKSFQDFSTGYGML